MSPMSRNGATARRRSAAAVLLGALAIVLAASAPAAASRGSVPLEVTAYLADGLTAQLTDLYGTDAAGGGIEFTETTTATATTRVFEFTGDFLAGEETEHPVRRLNEWVTIVSVDEAVVGVATVIIPPERELPELSLFSPEPALAAVLAEFPEDAALVRDSQRAAWYFLADDRLAAIVPGNSGLSGSISLTGFAAALAYPAAAAPQGSGAQSGVLVGGGTLLAGIAVVAVLVALSRRKRPVVAAAVLEPVAPVEPVETLESAPPVPDAELEPEQDGEPAAAKPADREPAAKPVANKPPAKNPPAKKASAKTPAAE